MTEKMFRGEWNKCGLISLNRYNDMIENNHIIFATDSYSVAYDFMKENQDSFINNSNKYLYPDIDTMEEPYEHEKVFYVFMVPKNIDNGWCLCLEKLIVDVAIDAIYHQKINELVTNPDICEPIEQELFIDTNLSKFVSSNGDVIWWNSHHIIFSNFKIDVVNFENLMYEISQQHKKDTL